MEQHKIVTTMSVTNKSKHENQTTWIEPDAES